MPGDSFSSDSDVFLDYDLPKELIAQSPIEPRDASRLLFVDRVTGILEDFRFTDLPDLLNPSDLMILNDSRVISGRLQCLRLTGAAVELLLLENVDGNRWEAMVNPLSRLRPGEELLVVDSSGCQSQETIQFIKRTGSTAIVELSSASIVESFGQVPLPPYIRNEVEDPDRYQTIYSQHAGSAAAPTAGLHFTPELLSRCRERGIEIRYLTLHVGLDTFRPLGESDPNHHQMHSERFNVPMATQNAVEAAMDQGRRIVSVGTTVTRVLESIAQRDFAEPIWSGRTSIYIKPPHNFQLVGAQITNFHLPRTTLLMLVSAFAGQQLLSRAYEHAIEKRYRFYSFGDAMLIV